MGLTGGIGMGKSTCAQLLRERGVLVVDTDDLAREVVQPGSPALAEIKEAFGSQVLDPVGGLRRPELARAVFSDATARGKLERILHPRIAELWRAQVEVWRREKHLLCVVVIPLLFEVGAEKEVDFTLCVACSERTQRSRLLTRGWSCQEIDQRLSAQWPAEQKVAKSDFVVWSEGSLEIHAQQLDRILATAREKPTRKPAR